MMFKLGAAPLHLWVVHCFPLVIACSQFTITKEARQSWACLPQFAKYVRIAATDFLLADTVRRHVACLCLDNDS